MDWLLNIGESTGGLISTIPTSNKEVAESIAKGLAVNQSLKSQSLHQSTEPKPVPSPSETLAEEIQVTGENKPFSYDSVFQCRADKVATIKTIRQEQVASVTIYSEHLTTTPDKLILSITRKMLEFGGLEPNWDSYRAKPVSLKVVRQAEKLFSQIVDQFYPVHGEKIRPCHIAPLPTGGVQFEWRGPSGEFEVEVHTNDRYNYLLTQGEDDNCVYKEDENVTASEILRLLSLIFDGTSTPQAKN